MSAGTLATLVDQLTGDNRIAEIREEWGARIYRDGQHQIDAWHTTEQSARAQVDYHRARAVDTPGWRGRAELIRRWRVVTVPETVEG